MPDEICPNGSARNPDVPDFIVIDNEHMTQLLPPDWQWLGQFLPFIGPIALDTNVLCSIDPPEYPDVGAIQWAALAAQVFTGGAQEAGRLVAQIVTNLLWYRLCHCLVDPTPPIPAAPAPPADLPAINPPTVVGPPGGASPCFSQMRSVAIDAGGPFEYASWTTLDGEPALTSVRLTVHHPPPAAGVWSPPALTVFLTGDDAIPLNATFTVAPAFDQVFTVLVSPLDHEIRVAATADSAHTLPSTWLIEGFCGVTPPGSDGSGNCCGPDPGMTARLDQILSMVTLLQRQGEPFAYVPGPAVHSGLVGFGELAVSGLIGVRLEVTTLPPELGHLAGTPDMLFDVGWVSIGTAEGWERRTRIDALEQLLIPAHMGLITRVGYSLSPNVVIRISELKREP